MLRWYLIHTKPSAEAIAQQNLDRQGYAVYLPRALQSVRRAGRRQDRTVPLFPRYLFLGVREGEQSLHPVQSTLGVAGIVRFGSLFAPVPEFIIRDLEARADPITGLHRINCEPALAAGAAVRIEAGPFDGLEGIFEREAGAARVVVLLRVLGHNARVCVAVHDVVALSRSSTASRVGQQLR